MKPHDPMTVPRPATLERRSRFRTPRRRARSIPLLREFLDTFLRRPIWTPGYVLSGGNSCAGSIRSVDAYLCRRGRASRLAVPAAGFRSGFEEPHSLLWRGPSSRGRIGKPSKRSCWSRSPLAFSGGGKIFCQCETALSRPRDPAMSVAENSGHRRAGTGQLAIFGLALERRHARQQDQPPAEVRKPAAAQDQAGLRGRASPPTMAPIAAPNRPARR